MDGTKDWSILPGFSVAVHSPSRKNFRGESPGSGSRKTSEEARNSCEFRYPYFGSLSTSTRPQGFPELPGSGYVDRQLFNPFDDRYVVLLFGLNDVQERRSDAHGISIDGTGDQA